MSAVSPQTPEADLSGKLNSVGKQVEPCKCCEARVAARCLGLLIDVVAAKCKDATS
jgi:hypothetical protein